MRLCVQTQRTQHAGYTPSQTRAPWLTQKVIDTESAQRLGHVVDGGTEPPQRQRLLRLLTGARQLALVFHTVQEDVCDL